jgi:hypothetical protein
MMRRWILKIYVVLLIVTVGGCGYTTKSQLPDFLKLIHVAPVKNGVDLSSEISDKTPFRVYRPGLEVELTNAIINRFIFDGQLKVTGSEKADAVVEATLSDYRRDALRYNEGDEIQEYRLSVVLDVIVTQKVGQKVLWRDRVTGDTTFFLSGARSISEDQAATRAVEDAARRVVEKTIEYW